MLNCGKAGQQAFLPPTHGSWGISLSHRASVLNMCSFKTDCAQSVSTALVRFLG